MTQPWEVIVIGGGIAGISAAIYLGRAQRRVLVIDAGKSLAVWEPEVENYLGFPNGISGEDLLRRGQEQAVKYEAVFTEDTVVEAVREEKLFKLTGKKNSYCAERLVLATGVFHLPPEIPHVDQCLGYSMFFCKDCDGHRVRGKRLAIVGHNNEAVEYALGMLHYTASVLVATNGHKPLWNKQHEEWLREYEITAYSDRITEVGREKCMLNCLEFADGRRVEVEALFTTRGDVFHNKLAKSLGAELDDYGQILVDQCLRTTVPGLCAAGCVTPANCQMIVAAGQGATAAQTLNRELFEESLQNHKLRLFREEQIRSGKAETLEAR